MNSPLILAAILGVGVGGYFLYKYIGSGDGPKATFDELDAGTTNERELKWKASHPDEANKLNDEYRAFVSSSRKNGMNAETQRLKDQWTKHKASIAASI